MKKVLFILSGVVLVASSCLKDKPNTDFSSITPIAELTTASTSGTPQAPVSGLAFWTGAAVGLSASGLDSVTFTANIASDYPLTVPTSITLAVDTTLVATFNAASLTQVTYQPMPASFYSFPVTSGTIPAGSRLDTFLVSFDASQFTDSAISYMLPITITSVTNNLTISGNLGTIYFNVQGNPLQGVYTVTGTHYTYAGSIHWTGPPAAIPTGSTSAVSLATYTNKRAVENGLTAVTLDFADLGASGYQYDITESSATNITVSYNFASDVAAITSYIISYTPDPTYPRTHASFELVTYYTDNSGNDNIVDETFTQQ